MHLPRSVFVVTLWLAALPAARLVAADAPLVLRDDHGAALEFSSQEDGSWRWSSLRLPGQANPMPVEEQEVDLTVRDGGSDTLGTSWTLASNEGDQFVFEQEAPQMGLRLRRIFSFSTTVPNTLRIELWVQTVDGEKTLRRIDLLAARLAGETLRSTGPAPASFPVFGHSLFAGIEHVSGIAWADGDTFRLTQTPNLNVTGEWQRIATVVLGWPDAGAALAVDGQPDIRGAFLRYLDTIRVHPADLELHTNTWWTLPLPFSEQDVLKDIEALRRGFYDRTGMFFDSYALDLGWSDPHSVWRVDGKRFPNEFRTINDRLAQLNCRLGLWASPGSAYPEGLDNKWLQSAGYELRPFEGRLDKVACFADGNRYQRATKASLIDYAQRYGLGHVKLDFMAHYCDVAGHGHPVGEESFAAIDAGLADVLDSLRAINPAMALEPLCAGYPPSPWWLMHTPYVLGPNGDDVPAGRVPAPQWVDALITARDIAYRHCQEEWLMPTSALETFDIVVQAPGEFENMAVMAIGRGRWFLSTYLKPDYMTPENWDFLAALVRWARANKQYLGNAQQIGGDPENRDAYGYVFHNADKEIYCARNPWMESRVISLPMPAALSAPRDVRMIFPRRAIVARLTPGGVAPTLTLAPYETVLLETVPATDSETPASDVSSPEIAISSGALTPSRLVGTRPAQTLRFAWNGTLTVPDGAATELCILVEGGTQVGSASCTASLDGRPVAVAKSTSEGQFYAAAERASEHWTWLTIPVPAGQPSFHLDLNVPTQDAAVTVFARGHISAASDPAPEDGPAFPVFHPESRAWSQLLVPRKEYSIEVNDTGAPISGEQLRLVRRFAF